MHSFREKINAIIHPCPHHELFSENLGMGQWMRLQIMGA